MLQSTASQKKCTLYKGMNQGGKQQNDHLISIFQQGTPGGDTLLSADC